jgi:hypothetical protein
MKLRNLVCGALLCASTLLVGCGDDRDNDFINGGQGSTPNGSTFGVRFVNNGSNATLLGDFFSDQLSAALLQPFGARSNPTSLDGRLTGVVTNGVQAGQRTFHFIINDASGITEGESFSFQSNPNAQGAAWAEYSELANGNGPFWTSTSGTITVVEIDDSGADFDFDARLTPSSGGATGTIDVSGEANINY